MRYIKFEGNQKATIQEKEMPVPAAGEVLVKVISCALCGSDLKLWRNGQKVIGGHEPFGVVEQPGHPLHGKRCLIYMPVYCGECEDCKAGNTNACTASSLIGWNRDGAYAEYLIVPEKDLVPVPDDIEDDLAPMLLDAVATPAHGIDLAERVLGDKKGKGDVLILGAGIIGLGALIVCKDRGYKNIDVSEPRVNRQEKVKALGANIRPSGDKSKRYDLVLECSGNLKARQEAIEVVKTAGAVVLLGENEQPWSMEENITVRRKDFYMIRSFYFPKSDILDNIDVLRRNKEEYRKFVDALIPFSKFEQEYERFAAGELTKPLFKPEV